MEPTDISFLNIAKDYSNNSEKIFKAMVGLSATGRYHYLDIDMQRFHSDMYYSEKISTSVILDVDVDALLHKRSPEDFFKYLNSILYSCTMDDSDAMKAYPDSFDKNSFKPIFKYVYDKCMTGSQEVLWSRLCTMLLVRGLHVTFGDSSRSIIYSIRLMKPKYISSSLSELAISMYNWEPGVMTADLMLEDMLIHANTTGDRGAVLMTVFMKEYDMFNNIVYDPHLKSVDDIKDIKTSYDVIYMSFMQFIIGLGLLKWNADKPDYTSTMVEYIPERTADVYSMFMHQNNMMPNLHNIKRLPTVDSLLFERSGSYFFNEYETKLTTIKGWNGAYKAMKWMRIYAIVATISSLVGMLTTIMKGKKDGKSKISKTITDKRDTIQAGIDIGNIYKDGV